MRSNRAEQQSGANNMKAHFPHVWTILIGFVSLALAAILLLGETTTTSFSGKHAERGWPLVYRKQDFSASVAYPTGIGESPVSSRAEQYVPQAVAKLDMTAFWIDVGVAVLIVAGPVTLCEWFLRRRARGGAGLSALQAAGAGPHGESERAADADAGRPAPP